MNMRVIARKNVLGNLQRYLAYFLSCVFSVTIFFIFSSFIFHPDVNPENIYGAGLVVPGLISCLVIIVVFSLFFVAYSNSSFLQVRKKEFGMLSLFGMTKSQLRRLVYYEQTAISLVAIIAGIGVGLLFTKLFYLIMSAFLDMKVPISFQLVPKALMLTAIGFFVLFQFMTFFSFFQIKKSQIVDLLSARQKPKPMPKFSKWLVFLSVLSLASCYYLAYTAGIMKMLIRMFPILILVLIGSYFFFTQSSVAFIRALTKRKASFYKGTTIITRSNNLFRIKDHAVMLFLATIITAVIMTASGVIFMFYTDLKNQVETTSPQAIGWVEHHADTFQALKPKDVEKELEQAGEKIAYKVNELAIPITFDSDSTGMMIAESSYNKVAKEKGFEQVKLKKGEAFFNFPYPYVNMEILPIGKKAEIQIGKEHETFLIKPQSNEGVLVPQGRASTLLIVPDNEFKETLAKIPEHEQVRLMGYELENWEGAVEVSEKLEKMVADDHQTAFLARAPGYQVFKKALALTLFLGLFVSCLFFVIQGSFLYLRLFTEVEDTKIQMLALRRMGVTKEEMKKILSRQISFLFFIPFIGGAIHATFAFKSLSNMLGSNLLVGSLTVFGIYFAFQLAYYAVTRYIYVRTVLR
ncbi:MULTISPECIES: FtsX-like permease family protein [Bacillus]|uniref:Peptide ABC transporter permease n=2 Tax=Bacillus TaxID=1386 RepID=A0A0M4GB68_9BACI|nr:MULTISPECIES: ABC transporter permease [Bacillus]ALC82903.1 peptide ABC transporter permease [Bacillus gobiensis]MBP1081881.1 putative ABC transport system permease protein [Bacillus capparidis]MED1096529.1 ABC transporter permease [Bacillus capparidis]